MVININIPDDKKEIITAFNALINAFKNDIEIRKENLLSQKKDINYQKAKEENKIEVSHDDFFSKYVGIVKGSTTDEEVNEYKINKYAK